MSLQYDDRNLQKLFVAMDPKQRMKALKGAFRREANRVRRVAVNNLRSSIRSDRDLERGIWTKVFKRKAGFSVSIATKALKKRYKGRRNGVRRYHGLRKVLAGYETHTNRRGVDLPIIIWAELGTKRRTTKSNARHRATRERQGHSTGRMPAFAFMGITQRQVRGSVTDSLHKEVVDSIIRVSKKYGCK